MAFYQLSSGQQNYTSTLVPTGSETGNRIIGNNLDNEITGNQYVDHISGGAGNDTLEGMGGQDILQGGAGNDVLDGGTGEDLLLGEDGNDILYGGAGNDRLWGGLGDDQYNYQQANGGVDTINDDKSPTGQTGYGGGSDILWMQDIDAQDIFFHQEGDDLWVMDTADAADGAMDNGIIIEDFFLGGNNVIERVYGADPNDGYYDFSSYV